jgi:hypothetical protein
MAGVVRARNVPARSDRLCRADNYALCRLPRFIHQPLPTRRSRHAAKELQIANTRAIAKICNTFALADPQMKIE